MWNKIRVWFLVLLLAAACFTVGLFAYNIPLPWAARLTYIKDERIKACFAVYDSVGAHFGPYFTYVPCELVDKADWQFYVRQAQHLEKH
jgi:hypothetical protein